jgi:hypothetical protein
MIMWNTLESNPHAQQASHPITNIPFTRTLEYDAPKKPYRIRDDKEKTAIHCGQRKLLMSEIEFLLSTLPKKKSQQCVVVYAGAAPGTHRHVLMHPPRSDFALERTRANACDKCAKRPYPPSSDFAWERTRVNASAPQRFRLGVDRP